MQGFVITNQPITIVFKGKETAGVNQIWLISRLVAATLGDLR